MRWSSLALLVLLSAPPAAAGELAFEEFALARSRLGGEVTGEGVLLWTGETGLADVECRLAVHDGKGGARDEFPAVRFARIPAGRAVRVRFEDRGVADFAAYEIEVSGTDLSTRRTARFLGPDPASPPVREGGEAPAVPEGSPSLEVSSSSVDGGEVRAEVRHAGGAPAVEVLLEIRIESGTGALIEERVVPTGCGLSAGESLAVRLAVAGSDVATARVRALAALRALELPKAQIGERDAVEVGRHYFVVLADGSTWGEVYLRNGLSEAIGTSRIGFAFADGSGREVASRTVEVPGPVLPGAVLRVEVRLEPGLAFQEYAYDLAWDPPPEGASPRARSRFGEGLYQVTPAAGPPEPKIRVEILGLRYVYREVQRGGSWVTKGGVYFLEIRFLDAAGGPVRPEGEVALEVRRNGATLGTARRKIDRAAWKRDFDDVNGRNVKMEIVAFDEARRSLAVGLFALGETREFDFEIELEIEAGGGKWTFRGLADPFREVARPPGTWTER